MTIEQSKLDPIIEASVVQVSTVAGPEPDEFAIPQRLPPISLGFEIFSGIRQQLFPAIVALFSATSGGIWGLFFGGCFFLISISVSIVKYLALRYQIRGEELIVDEGIFFRVHRTVPLKRIQNIDLLQNPLHRWFGVAEVRVETASGTEPEAILRVLKLVEIDRLRSRVFAHREALDTGPAASSVQVSQAPESSRADVPPLLSLSTPMLIKAGLANNRGMFIVAVILGGLFQVDPWNGRVAFNIKPWIDWLPLRQANLSWLLLIVLIIFLGLLALRILSAVWYVVRFYDYELVRSGNDLKIRCGLLTKVSANVPRDRIQFISIHRTLVGRWVGIASIRIETAGGGTQSNENAASTISRRWFIPAIAEADIPRIVAELRPGLNWNEKQLNWLPVSRLASKRMRRRDLLLAGAALIAALCFQAWILAAIIAALASIAWWYAGKKAKSNRYVREDFGIAFRSGLLVKKCSITFPEAIQTVRVSNSPFDRRWTMATLSIDTAAAGPAEHTIHVPMLDYDFALSERDAIASVASRSFVDLPLFHDKRNRFQSTDVGQRISSDGNDISDL